MGEAWILRPVHGHEAVSVLLVELLQLVVPRVPHAFVGGGIAIVVVIRVVVAVVVVITRRGRSVGRRGRRRVGVAVVVRTVIGRIRNDALSRKGHLRWHVAAAGRRHHGSSSSAVVSMLLMLLLLLLIGKEGRINLMLLLLLLMLKMMMMDVSVVTVHRSTGVIRVRR